MVVPLHEVVDEQSLIAAAMTLPASSRLNMAEQLWLSVDPLIDESINDEWSEEIRRRIEDVDTGRVTAIPAEVVHAELRKL